jgi:hypothetical protein
MKMKNVIIGITTLLTSSLIIGCSEEAKTPEGNETEVKELIEVAQEASSTTIWDANIETTIGFNNMIKIMDKFTGTDEVESYSQLVSDLKVEYNLIFKNCTMTGEAHDHLHDYIMPFSGYLKGLKSGDLETAQNSFKEMRAHLGDYKNRFK